MERHLAIVGCLWNDRLFVACQFAYKKKLSSTDAPLIINHNLQAALDEESDARLNCAARLVDGI